ncbi:unnamed protein product [Closterium sp. NIES-65]|nr:unnamed protein product [Closterium sp. NIES-65]
MRFPAGATGAAGAASAASAARGAEAAAVARQRVGARAGTAGRKEQGAILSAWQRVAASLCSPLAASLASYRRLSGRSRHVRFCCSPSCNFFFSPFCACDFFTFPPSITSHNLRPSLPSLSLPRASPPTFVPFLPSFISPFLNHPQPPLPPPLRPFLISGGHPAVYIVRLRSAPAIPAYVGGIPGFPATASPVVVAEAAAVAAARGNGKRVRPHGMTTAADAEENDELDDDDYNEDDEDNYGDENNNTESDVPDMAGIRVSVKPRTGSGGAGGKEVPRGPVPATRGVRVNVQAAHVKAFARMLVRQQQQVVAETRLSERNMLYSDIGIGSKQKWQQQQQVVAETRVSERNMLYSYKFAANGFAARLTQADVRRLKRHAMVADVTRSYGVRSATTYTPRFLQLPGSMWKSSGGGSRAGEGVVIGVVDTGIWPEHPSFRVANSSHVYPRPPRRWAGKCVRTRDFPASRCTRKLVGARFFSRAYEAQGGVVDTQYDFRSPRDADGHGTWCAGTAAGTGGTPVLTSERPPVRSLGIASGMAPGAHLAVYKVLWTNATLAGYGELADVHYAIDRAIKDGVDVLSLSLGGLGPDQHYFDDLLYLLANQAGMVVVTAAGNLGPAPNLGLWNRFGIYRTISNFSPFYLTVGASSIGRRFLMELRLGSGLSGLSGSIGQRFLTELRLGGGLSGWCSPLDSIGRRFLTELRLGSGRVVYASGVGSGTYATRRLPLLSAADAAGPESSLEGATHCLPESLSPARARGAIVLCTRGMVGVQDKLRSVAAAGGVAMILANEDGGLIDLNTLSATAGAPIPFIHVNLAQARIIRAYIQNTPKPTATIMARCHILENAAPPMIASFSSTGPTVNPRTRCTCSTRSSHSFGHVSPEGREERV